MRKQTRKRVAKKRNTHVNCCRHTRKNKQCIRKNDKRIFKLPRKWSRKQCLNSSIKGFSMKSSCAPYLYCK